MDVVNIVDLISNIGFPIVCVLGLGWYIKDQGKSVAEAAASREKQLLSTIAKQEALIKAMNDTNAGYLATLNALTIRIEDTQNDVEKIKDILNVNQIQKEGE